MSETIRRVAVYLNGSAEPAEVREHPPYHMRLDTYSLPEGRNVLRVETELIDGRRSWREITFEVQNSTRVLVDGLDEGAQVRGELDLRVRIADEPPVASRVGSGIGIAAIVAVLATAWALSATFVPQQQAAAAAPGRPPTTAAAATPAAAPVDQAYLKAGGDLYAQHCSTCHQASGEGIPAAFPPLAGNADLAAAGLIVTTVHSGHAGKITVAGRTFDQSMPAIGAGFSAMELAEVATYVRNSWGNDFGGVTLAQAEAALRGKETGGAAADSATASGAKGPPVDGALLTEGEGLYAQNCATCHRADGKGVPGAFPPLAGNPNLSEALMIVQTVHSGHSGKIMIDGRRFDQTMPAIGAGFTAEQLAAVATYVRNSWGNHLGGVTTAEATRDLGQEADGH